MSRFVLIPEEFWPLLVRVSVTIAICVVISAAIVLMRRAGRRSAAPTAGMAETSTLIPRAVVWIVAACVMLVCDVLGTMALAALLSVLAVQAVRELLRALAAAGAATDVAPVTIACLAMIVGAAFAGGAAFGSMLAVTLLLVAIYFMATTTPSSAFIARLTTGVTATIYVGVPLAALVLLRQGPRGFALVAWIILVISLADVAAMLGGLLFGRRRIVPGLSPGKTLEGAAAGVVGALLAGVLVRFALPDAPEAVYYGCTAILAGAGFAGDLFASTIKRAAGAKDFGTILPGHGGLLDRLDSLLFGAPIGYVLSSFVLAV